MRSRTIRRATSFSAGGTESSRSSTMASAPEPGALSSIFGRLPGTKSRLRSSGSIVTSSARSVSRWLSPRHSSCFRPVLLEQGTEALADAPGLADQARDERGHRRDVLDQPGALTGPDEAFLQVALPGRQFVRLTADVGQQLL